MAVLLATLFNLSGAVPRLPNLGLPLPTYNNLSGAVPRSVRLRPPGHVAAGECGRAMRELVKVKTAAFRSGEDAVGMLEEADLAVEETTVGRRGFEATLNRLSKWIVTAVFCAVVLLKHDAESLWAVTGSVLNSILSHVLKRILNQERPVSTLRSGPGMPSSHAQSIFFIVSFIILSSVEWRGIDVISVMISILALAIGSYLTWLRVSQNLHTIGQVTVGAVVGTIFAVLWFWSWKGLIFKLFASFLWVRIVVILGAASFCLGFLVFAFCHWRNE